MFLPQSGTCLTGGKNAPKVGVELLQEVVVRHFQSRFGDSLSGTNRKGQRRSLVLNHSTTHDTGICYQPTDGSQVRVDLVHELVHRLGIRRIDLVRLGLYIELFRNLFRLIRRILAAVVDDGYVAARLGDLSRDGESDASVAAGDDDGLARLKAWRRDR